MINLKDAEIEQIVNFIIPIILMTIAVYLKVLAIAQMVAIGGVLTLPHVGSLTEEKDARMANLALFHMFYALCASGIQIAINQDAHLITIL